MADLPPDICEPVSLARGAYDAADYARERAECVALHLERGNVEAAARYLRELKRQAVALGAYVAALEIHTNPQPKQVTHG